MKPFLPKLAILLALSVSSPVWAALEAGTAAPDFTAEAALAGDTFAFSMAEARANGPVVLYFYPKAFTKGCTLEAHSFAEAMDDFKGLGATVIGVSNDTIDTLEEFSVSACGGKFAVAADPNASIIQAYDAGMASSPGTANRISYVIAPDGRVLYEYSSMNPDQHVANTLAAIRDWRNQGKTTTH